MLKINKTKLNSITKHQMTPLIRYTCSDEGMGAFGAKKFKKRKLVSEKRNQNFLLSPLTVFFNFLVVVERISTRAMLQEYKKKKRRENM